VLLGGQLTDHSADGRTHLPVAMEGVMGACVSSNTAFESLSIADSEERFIRSQADGAVWTESVVIGCHSVTGYCRRFWKESRL
jgi:hypothetical protein